MSDTWAALAAEIFRWRVATGEREPVGLSSIDDPAIARRLWEEFLAEYPTDR